MDQTQQQHHPMTDDHNAMNTAPYYYGQDDTSYGLAYNAQLSYPVPQHAPQPPIQAGIQQYHTMGLLPHQFQPNVYPGSPPHGSLPVAGSPPPPSPDLIYDPLSPPVSGSDTSGEGLYHHSSSGANSPSSSRANSLVHRTVRYNPTPSPTGSISRRRGRSHDSDEEDNMVAYMGDVNVAHNRKEATRRQRIEAEQRRRDELRDGYARLKDVLPVSNQKSSKVSLLERATNHIKALDKANKELQARLSALEAEMQRLRQVNEKISLSSANNTPSPGNLEGARPISPPPDDIKAHSAMAVKAPQTGSERSSPSASENGL